MAKKFTREFLTCMSEQQITHVRVGTDHPKFTGIWMVVVKGRIFARSYYLRERSWYTALMGGEAGEIKCIKESVPIVGVKPHDIASVTAAVNKAYEKKYCVRESNRKWVDGLCEEKRVERTMEFLRA